MAEGGQWDRSIDPSALSIECWPVVRVCFLSGGVGFDPIELSDVRIAYAPRTHIISVDKWTVRACKMNNGGVREANIEVLYLLFAPRHLRLSIFGLKCASMLISFYRE